MNLLTVIVVLVVVGIVLYLINRFVPMDGKIKTILNWAVVIILIIWLVRATGLLRSISNVNL